MVAFRDGSVLAQLGQPDMRIPIAYTLGWPERLEAPTPRLDLARIGRLTFGAPDPVRFPALRLAREALAAGGTVPTVLNAANEVAVAAFLASRLGFLDIAAVVEATKFLREREALEKANEGLRLELLENSLRDPLTSLYNRRFLSETLSLEDRRGYAILMLDIDHFKTLNDEFGHLTGDSVLQAIAKMLQRNTRRGDVICRYGGEEFTVVMRGASLSDGYGQAEQIRRACSELKLSSRDGAPLGTITLSAGVAAFPDNGDSGRSVLGEADRALYLAKDEGRNRSETASPVT
jgi:diguanylate cyclase (GGDEF)-like protein